jgi:hypothetical protein
VILLSGIPSESPLAMVATELERLGAAHLVFNQRRFADASPEWELVGGVVRGQLQLGGAAYPVEEVRGACTRLMDDRFLPSSCGNSSASTAMLSTSR